MNSRYKNKSRNGFTPLEKATDEVGGGIPYKADGGLKPPLSAVSPVRNNGYPRYSISNGIREQTVKKRSSLTGFTLAESLMAVVILAMAAAGILLPFASGAVVRNAGNRRTLATKLAADLMEKIVSTPYDNILTAYGSYSETQGQVKDINGNVFTDPAYAGFSRDASCTEVYVVQQQPPPVTPVFIQAIVTVYYLGEEIVSVTRLIGKGNAHAIFKSWSFGGS